MGTHPIFESDFDCLTELKNKQKWIRSRQQCNKLDKKWRKSRNKSRKSFALIWQHSSDAWEMQCKISMQIAKRFRRNLLTVKKSQPQSRPSLIEQCKTLDSQCNVVWRLANDRLRIRCLVAVPNQPHSQHSCSALAPL